MRRFIFVVMLSFSAAFIGCNKTTEQPQTLPAGAHVHADGTVHVGDHGAVHDVDGWCVEHEVMEKICSLCSSKAAAEFKKNGDWCKEHDRAESQCFICDPSRKEKSIAQYEAQYGKKPPKNPQ
ncbi:MAG: hypothetical protein LBQ66_15110 [Planctomycetaceae bacterium]|jgi:hypothetical protein|nr:hypothetical protein [Planctomycetaceae bacterium]